MCSGKASLFPNPPGQPGRGNVPSQPGGVSESEWAVEVLQKAGLRVTGARIGVLKVMASHRGSYLRPEDVARWWIKADSMVSVTTAYRVLAQLAEVGLLRRGLTPAGKAVYALPAAQPEKGIPLHLPDGRVIELEDAALLARIRQAALQAGVDVSTLKIEVLALSSSFPPAGHSQR